MTSGMVLKARAKALLGFVLALAGMLPVLLFVALSLSPAAMLTPLLAAMPEASSLWWMDPAARLPAYKELWVLGAVHPTALLALLGVGFMGLGELIVRRQRAVLAAAAWQRQERLRRVRQYRAAEQAERSSPGSESAGSPADSARRVA